jgi:hypothetical protein
MVWRLGASKVPHCIRLAGKWCCRKGLNFRPLHYQWSALPLSYGSLAAIRAAIGGGSLPMRVRLVKELALRQAGRQAESKDWERIAPFLAP